MLVVDLVSLYILYIDYLLLAMHVVCVGGRDLCDFLARVDLNYFVCAAIDGAQTPP
jgi:hypothetical protein